MGSQYGILPVEGGYAVTARGQIVATYGSRQDAMDARALLNYEYWLPIRGEELARKWLDQRDRKRVEAA
jgi:hypothetical protein